jgi:membrane fusion protein (multidrug efflux system)
MKYIIPTLVLSILMAACAEPIEDVYPEDLEGKKVLLRTKKQELNELTSIISQLEEEIASLDPNIFANNGTKVVTTQLKKRNFEHYIEIQGSIQADDYVDGTSEAAGRILKLTVKEGDQVRAGQLIAELDLEQLKKQIAEIEKSQELANTLYERQKRLWDQNIGSEMQYLEAKNNKERLEKSIETLQFQMSKSKVYAPVSGLVDRVILQAGEMAVPGAPIIQILNPNKLKVVADVPETYLKAISRGKEVNVQFPAIDVEQQARVTLIGSTIDPANRTFEVEANIKKSNNLIKPNLLAIMYIKDYQEEDVVTVPIELVQQEVGGKDFVYIVGKNDKGDGIAQKVYVQTGNSYDGEIVIEKGLTGSEVLITEGARGLAENERVSIKTEG